MPVTLNKYAYANSDPINGRDPSGLADTTLSGEMVATDVNATLQTNATTIFKVTLREAGCFAIQYGADEATNAAIYIFWDTIADLPYVGRTTQGVQTRIDQHKVAKIVRKAVEPIMAVFHVDPTIEGKVLAELEQNIINIMGKPGKPGDPRKTLSNFINAIKESEHKAIRAICK